MFEKNRNLTQKLAECVNACNECMIACLGEDDVKMMVECIKLDKECSIICATTLQLIYKDSYFMKDMLQLCTKACEACAEECRKYPEDHCQECAKVCKECAEACREFNI